jgi:hypothetical protein
MTIKQGDVVFLNSGSPEMTVEKLVGVKATCSYVDDLNDIRIVNFDVACLTHTNPKEPV